MLELTFTAPVWLHDGGSWHFVTLPADSYDVLRADGPGVGFGSVRVEATIGKTTWKTSVFPDSKLRSFVLPVKAAVRATEEIEDGTSVEIRLRVLD